MLSHVYSSAVALRGRLYDSGILKTRRLGVPVLSVGNLTVGGSGKSPLVARIARLLAGRGIRPAVVSRGYGGAHKGDATVVSEGHGPLVDARTGGDEPVMLALQLAGAPGGIPVIVSRRRYDGGRKALSAFGVDCIVLDDGFQHRALARDLDLLLMDGSDPFGNGRVLPAGPLREPVAAMARAGALVVTRSDRATPAARDAIGRAASAYNPQAPIFQCTLRATRLMDVGRARTGSLEPLRGARVYCFAGIARPEAFFLDAAAAGAEIVGTRAFPDHHRFSPEDLRGLTSASSRASADLLLTTEKDAARLGTSSLPELFAMMVEASIEEERAFSDLLGRAVS